MKTFIYYTNKIKEVEEDYEQAKNEIGHGTKRMLLLVIQELTILQSQTLPTEF